MLDRVFAGAGNLYNKGLSAVGVDPDNPLARGVGEAASTLAHAPGAIYHAVRDPLTPEEQADFQGHTRIPGEVTAERLLGARQLVKGGKDWINPKTRPTWEQVKYMAPEALGQGAAQYVTGELMGKVTSGSAQAIADTIRNVPAIADAIHMAGRSVEQKTAIDRGAARVYTDNVKVPVETYRAKVSQEIAKHAQAVEAMDTGYNRMNSIHGAIDLTSTLQKGTEMLEQVGKTNPAIERIRQNLGQAQASFNEAKNLLSDIGGEASKAAYTKNARPAAVLWEMYDTLSNAIGDHVKDNLGGQAKRFYDHYRNEHRTMMEHSALLDDMAGGATPQEGLYNYAEAANNVGGKGRQNELAALKKDMEKYGVDTESLGTAARMGADLKRLTQHEQNLFVGKVRAIIQHPVTIGSAAVAAGMVGGAVGPIGHIVAPLLVAAKMTNMMDAVGIAKLLREVNATTRPESEMAFRNAMEGPLDIPPTEGPQVPRGGLPPAQPQPGGAAAQPSPAPAQPGTPGAGQASAMGGRGATLGEAEDMAEAQSAEELRQLENRQVMAKKLSQAKKGKAR
jgi:hypothetical protein